MRILVTTPSMNFSGGVSNHYRGLKHYWTENVRYLTVGKRKIHAGGILWLPFDIVNLFFTLKSFKPDVVLLNPSMSRNAIKRDMIFFRIAKWMKFKVKIMFHGFHTENVDSHKNEIVSWINGSDGVIVLANSFKKILLEWGVVCPIDTISTKVPDELVSGFDINIRKGEIKNILYLARVTEGKGIFVSIDTFILLHKKYPNLHFTVVGNGNAMIAAKERAACLGDNITFTGEVSGNDLVEQLKNGDLYLFSSYHEGMPASVLEAMAFGLPVITRAVGGLCDFFEDGKMGRITDSLNPEDFAKLIEPYLLDEKLVKETSVYNHLYAKDHFMASKVAEKIEKILFEV